MGSKEVILGTAAMGQFKLLDYIHRITVQEIPLRLLEVKSWNAENDNSSKVCCMYSGGSGRISFG